MRWAYAFLDLIFYGNFWIALAAAAMVIQTNHLINAEYLINPFVILVFGGTLFIYGVHRAVGISRLKDFLAEKRYGVIYHYRNHIRIYASFGLLLSGYCFFLLDLTTKLLLIIPAILSALYVIPIYGKKRLRDINDIKIYLIAFVFAVLTVLLPIVYLQGPWNLSIGLLFLERLLFVFLLTIPFDIRDLKVDKYSEVATLPSRFGLPFAKKMIWVTAITTSALVIANYFLGFYSLGQGLGLIISLVFACWAGIEAHPNRHDYYYTGVIDGIMILQCALVLLLGTSL